MSTYINSAYLDRCSTESEPVNWTLFTEQRLAWLYGANHEAQRRAKTKADLAAWNRLGVRDAA